MYYEEKVINGLLCWRNTPDGKFIPMAADRLTARYLAQQNRADKLQGILEGLLADPYGCTHCDSGKARNEAKGHQPDCLFEAARAAVVR